MDFLVWGFAEAIRRYVVVGQWYEGRCYCYSQRAQGDGTRLR